MNSKENCDNLQVMCQDLENYGTQTKQAIMDYRHRLWDCFCECNWLHQECKEALMYFISKTWAVLDLNKLHNEEI